MESDALASSSAESSTARTTDQTSSMAFLFWSWLKKLMGFLFWSWLKKLMKSDESESSTTAESSTIESSTIAESSTVESSTARVWKYDVFLSFRGPDTRKGITFELYDRLQNRGIKTFMDDRDLEVGDVISSTLLKAIEESRFAIIVLSPDYASSPWCLEELAKICECMEDNNRILPLFYKVDPGDVRHQQNSFGDAFKKHETSGRHRSEKMQQWRNALKKVASFSGWDSKTFKTERQLVEGILESVYSKVQPTQINVGDFEEFEATRQAMNAVTKALKDGKVTAVGVYGMGGVGKTSLVKHVGAQSRKIGIFHHVIMGVVSQSPDLIKIQSTLAELLGFKMMENTEIGRAARLKKEIMRREKILIILDDVWSRIEVSDIGIPSLNELQSCNSKLILTTRRKNVCHSMGCQETITLNVLSEVDSWALFVRNARRSSFESTNFEDLARKVAAECSGLPISLIAVAKALGDKDLAEWERAARRLEKSQRAHPDDEDYAFKCIKLSYDYLTDEDSKSCFLLCCLFPEDWEIRIEDLIKYAIGKGLFQANDTIHEARETAYTVVAHLKNCSLLLDGNHHGHVKMHDVIRDTALNIADGSGFRIKSCSGLKDWPCQSHGGYSAISLMRNKILKLPKKLECPNLQILLLQNNVHLNEISEAFFQGLNELRVLDLSGTSVSLLPHSFSLLTNLQALYLDFCDKIIDISILGKLKKLEILSMRRSPPKELSRGIGNLSNLRMLDVSCIRKGIFPNPSKVISKLHRLEELYMGGCEFENWRCTDYRKIIVELAGLPNLKVLQVSIPNAKYIPENVKVEPNLVYFNIHIGGTTAWRYHVCDRTSRSLILEDTTIHTLPDWFANAVARKTEKLEYPYCRELTDILMEYDHGRLHGLKHLAVGGLSSFYQNLKVLMNTTRRVQKGPVFENLEELHLQCLFCLEELCVGELPAGSLINLKVFSVRDCCSLGNVSELLQRLPNLEKLYLAGMYKMEYVFGCEGFEAEQSKLRQMDLFHLDSLKSICNSTAPPAMFQSLKRLTIMDCRLLRSLFASDVAQCLFQLEDLRVMCCPLLERVIEASKETVNSKKTVLPELMKLVMKKLPKLYTGSATVDIECPSLEQLSLANCPSLSFSTSASEYFHSRYHVQVNT